MRCIGRCIGCQRLSRLTRCMHRVAMQVIRGIHRIGEESEEQREEGGSTWVRGRVERRDDATRRGGIPSKASLLPIPGLRTLVVDLTRGELVLAAGCITSEAPRWPLIAARPRFTVML